MTKRCSRCKQVKPTAEFYKNHSAADGLQYYCMPCKRAVAKVWRATSRGKASKKRRDAKYRARNPGKRKAHNTINNKIHRGVLPKANTQLCATCGNPAQQYHHPDYTKPLEVVALCVPCHRTAHLQPEVSYASAT